MWKPKKKNTSATPKQQQSLTSDVTNADVEDTFTDEPGQNNKTDGENTSHD